MQAKQKKPEWLSALDKQISDMDKEDMLYSKAVYVSKKAADIYKTHNDNLQQSEELAQSDLYMDCFKRTKMYLQHFLISFSMMVERGEVPASYFRYYGIGRDEIQLSDDITDVELESLCRKVFVGEDERIRNTDSQRVFNPSSVQVQAQYDIFHSYFEMLQILREHCRKSQFALDAISQEAKSLSLKLSK